jgi:para-aminobenzoate synthetase
LPTLIIDNYDSFTYNLVSAVAVITGEQPLVVRNDEKTWDEIRKLEFSSVIISPGPGRPDRARDFGVSAEAIRHAAVPVLGVCLGHQGIASAFGGLVVQTAPVHGQPSEIIHDGDDLFHGIPERFSAIRYHSLAVIEPLPPELRKIAWTADGTVMALRHVSRPLWGVQFHPESICTEYGIELLRNFLALAGLTFLRASVRKTPLVHAPETLFRGLFKDEPFAFWLDSALVTERSRFSYMGTAADVFESGNGDEEVFDFLDRALRSTRVEAPPVPFAFTGGYVGYFGYELKAECGSPNKHRSALPDSVLLRVDRFLVIDHREQALYTVCLGDDAEAWLDETESRMAAIDASTCRPRPKGSKPIERYQIPREDYLARIRESQSLIQAGESYEICLTNQVLLESDLPALDYYETLRRTNPAPYAAYLRLGEIELASTSPECFLRIDQTRRAESRPIKGTIRRGHDEEEDARFRDLLASDSRYRAENLMIVDLVRNDLAHVCSPGTVHVPRLMEVETYKTLHQLVSTISGQLAPDATAVDCLRALFPGGSMTGAPKLRTMELLDQLEPEARGIYSGSIGYLGFNGTVDLSIVIRTAVFHRGQISLGVGGAIVAQSDPEAEWDEMQLKAQALLRAFELTPGPTGS